MSRHLRWLPALALLALALVLAGLWQEARRSRTALEREHATLTRLLAERAPPAGAEDVARRLEALPWQLVAESPAVAAADAQGLVTRRVEAAGAELVSVQVAAPEPGVPPRLPLELRLVAGNHRVLRDLLHALEYGRPAFLIDRLEILGEERGARLRVALALSLFLAGDVTRPEEESGG